MAFPARRPAGANQGILALSPPKETARPMRDEDRTRQKNTGDRHRPCACSPLAGSRSCWSLHKYRRRSRGGTVRRLRQRHPIALQEADRSIVIFVGHARGAVLLHSGRRMGLARTWFAKEPVAIVAMFRKTPNHGCGGFIPGSPGTALRQAACLTRKSRCAYHRRLQTFAPRLSYQEWRRFRDRAVCGRGSATLIANPATLKTSRPQFLVRDPAQPRLRDRQSYGPRTAAI